MFTWITQKIWPNVSGDPDFNWTQDKNRYKTWYLVLNPLFTVTASNLWLTEAKLLVSSFDLQVNACSAFRPSSCCMMKTLSVSFDEFLCKLSAIGAASLEQQTETLTSRSRFAGCVISAQAMTQAMTPLWNVADLFVVVDQVVNYFSSTKQSVLMTKQHKGDVSEGI